ncbi:MAG TPA: hypothetical protein VNJ08_04820 [Bacteriovoracaceae bacterium]|nr:hypothetical protein [Bacteriovoracaceae bacterium]
MLGSKRKVILINRKFQLNIIAHFMGLSLISIAAFYAANLWFFHKFLDLGKEMGLPSEHVFFQFINSQKLQMNWIFLTVSIVVLIILTLGGAILSHKVAGPIYRLCKHLKGIETGDEVKPLSFREGDYFLEIVDHINPILKKVDINKK